jgi:hypothetical protein
VVVDDAGDATTEDANPGSNDAGSDADATSASTPDGATDASDGGAGPDGSDATAAEAGDAGDAGSGSDAGDGGNAADADAGTTSDGAIDGGDAASDASDAGSAPDADAGDASFDGSDGAEAGPPCDPDASACSSGLTCCSGTCVDTSLDPRNCGSCGNACGSASFCTGTACVPAVLANICDNPRATVVLDPFIGDNQASLAVGSAVLSTCMIDAGVPQVYESDAGDVGTTWRPSTGVGNTYIACGGAYGQHGVSYLDDNGLTSLYLITDGTTAWFDDRNTLLAVVTTPVSSLTAHHDFFFLQVTVEPTTGTLSLMGVGILGPGTAAAGYYASAVVIPAYATYTDAWYAYEWTDTNGDSIANAGDTFTLVAQGM